MKNIYIKSFFLFNLFLLVFYMPQQAQCLCSGGVPATPISQSITIAPTTVSTLNFTFQQFNPALGTLSCVRVYDTITGVSTTGARNTGPDSTDFLFLLSLTNKVSGPGFSITKPFSQTYGYDRLAPYGDPLLGDSITYGPTNIITTPTGTASTTGNAAYLGVGTVNISYSINGGMITQDGGSNYKSSVSTTIGGTIRLIYYYCPSALLASGLQNFTALKTGRNILLKWDAQNSAAINNFEVEYSIDGTNFTSVANVASDHSSSNRNYSYNYMLNGNSSGVVYFRIKQFGNADQYSYSPVQKINLASQNNSGVSIYPNPVATSMTLNFERPVSGDYSIELLSASGQVVYSRKTTLSNASSLPVNFGSKPAPGLYFARLTNTASKEQTLARLIIR